jgi:peptide deformylase
MGMGFRKFLVIVVPVLVISALIAYLLQKGDEDIGFESRHQLSSQQEKQAKPASPEPITEKKKTDKLVQKETLKKRPVYSIHQFNNPEHQSVLNTPAKPVTGLPSPEIDHLIKSLHHHMSANVGGGISANQLGKSLQVFLIGPPPMINSSAPSDVFINPVITNVSKGRSCFWHGCLSSKGEKFGKVATWNSITIKAQDSQGRHFTRKLNGLDAIVAQHEFRHLLGGGYHDHAEEFEDEKTLFQSMLKGKLKMLEVCDESAPFLLNDYQVGETISQYAVRKNKEITEKGGAVGLK